MNMKTEYQCKSRMKHTLLIGTAMFLISPITLSPVLPHIPMRAVKPVFRT